MTAPSIIVVGAGPAGTRAAQAIAGAGLRPIVLDEAAASGGQIYRQPPVGRRRAYADLYGFEHRKARAIHDVFRDGAGTIDYRPRTQVLEVAGNTLTVTSDGGLRTLRFDRLVLATGATDRPFPFSGWTLPGVFTLGAAQVALKTQGVSIGKRTVLVGAGPLLPLVAYQYLKAGAEIAAILDLTPLSSKLRNGPAMLRDLKTTAKGLFYLGASLSKRIPTCFGVRKIRALGDRSVTGLSWIAANGREHEVACDAIGASMGLRSEIQLTELAGCKMAFNDRSRQFLPVLDAEGRSSQAHVYLAGDGAAIGGADFAEIMGERVALLLLSDLGMPVSIGRLQSLERRAEALNRFRRALDGAYPFPGHVLDKLDDPLVVCRCENVSVGDIRRAVAETGEPDINRIKANCRVGMGRCQGRMCGLTASEVVAAELSIPVATLGVMRSQPPVRLLTMQLAAAPHGGGSAGPL